MVSWDQGHGSGSLQPGVFRPHPRSAAAAGRRLLHLETPGGPRSYSCRRRPATAPRPTCCGPTRCAPEVHPFEDAARYDDTTLRLLYAELQPEAGHEFPPAPAPEPDGRWRIVAGEPANIGLQLYRQSEPLVSLAYTDGTPVILGDPAPEISSSTTWSPRIVAAMGRRVRPGSRVRRRHRGRAAAHRRLMVTRQPASGWWSAGARASSARTPTPTRCHCWCSRCCATSSVSACTAPRSRWSIDGKASLDDQFPGDGVVLGDLCTEEFEGQARHLTVTAKYRTLISEAELRFRCPAAPQGDSGLLGCACSAGTDVAPVHGLAPSFVLWCVRRRRRRRATSR
ncbi:MAG: hypothetical protein IPK74_39700 [Deltaproteobacteria bacterium]|nr:hypothetical protein [Deltaproteobacteria bacterium]